MKTFLKCILPAIALLAMACTGGEKQTGKPYEELPAIQEDQLWSFFTAIPKESLPEKLQDPDARRLFRNQFYEMQDGLLGDGDGVRESWYESENGLYWSDYFTLPEDYDWADEPEDATHPFAQFYAYMNPDGTRLYGILETGHYAQTQDVRNEPKYYWYDLASGKVSPAKLLIDKPYTTDDLAEDTLLHYGSNSLYYSLKNGDYSPTYFDRGFEVYIENVGDAGIRYEWDGTQFVKTERKHIMALYDYGFSNIQLRQNMPFDIPGYQNISVESENPYERIYELRKEGESTPTLVFHTSQSLEIIDLEVCTERYASVYNIYPGMPFQEFKDIVDEMGSWYEEAPYFSVVDNDDEFVCIFCGFDENFYYLVEKKYYKGNNMFAPNAKIARVGITSAVG